MILSQIEKEKQSFSVPADGGLPEEVGEEAGAQAGSKGRFSASKSFAIASGGCSLKKEGPQYELKGNEVHAH
jgi:hypothetical protein